MRFKRFIQEEKFVTDVGHPSEDVLERKDFSYCSDCGHKYDEVIRQSFCGKCGSKNFKNTYDKNIEKVNEYLATLKKNKTEDSPNYRPMTQMRAATETNGYNAMVFS